MRIWLALAGVNGAVAVAMSAMAAHPPGGVDGFAARALAAAAVMHLAHALALLAIDSLAARISRFWRTIASILFQAGMLLFSGALYIYALADMRAVASAAPFGGTALILGWLALAIAGLRAQPPAAPDRA